MPPTRYAWITASALAIALAIAAPRLPAQQGTGKVRGTITDSTSQAPIPNAQVLAIGTGVRALTSATGQYVLNGLPAGAVTVRVQVLGYAPTQRALTLAAGDSAIADFALRQTVQQLDAVVVEGYGTTTRRDATSAVSSLASSQIENNPNASLDQSLEGQVPGVTVSQNAGAPGTAMTVQIRGPSSISASNQPLYVVDGVPINTDNLSEISAGGQNINGVTGIDANEIESIDVLKDAAATAIYGSRGSNGVVQITTKRGREGKSEVTFGAYTGTQDMPHQLPLMNAKQYLQYHNMAAANDGYGDNYYGTPGVDDIVNTNWQTAIMHNAGVGNAELAVRGGTDQLKYRLGGSYFNQDGIMRGSAYNRYTGRANIDLQVTPKLGVSTSLGLSRESNDRVEGDGNDYSPLTMAIGLQPNVPVHASDGTFTSTSDNLLYPNALALASLENFNALTTRMLGNVEGRYDVFPSLRFTTRYGFDQATLRENQYLSPQIIGTYPASNGGVAKQAYSTGSRSVFDNFLTWAPTLGERSVLTVVGGSSVELNTNEFNFIRGEQLSNDLLHRVGNAAQAISWDGSQLDSRLVSFFGRANYALSGKYLFSASLRADGSSRFGPNHKYGYFPALSVGWNISDESFLKSVTWIDNLKIRGSWGITGNQSVTDYAAQGLVSACNYGSDPGLCPASISNPNLKWESTTQYDMGVDFFTFRGRLGITSDFYVKNTNDLLLDKPVSLSSGYATVIDNVGAMQNKGWELGLTTVNVKNVVARGFRWSSSLTFAVNRNKVTALYANQPFTGGVKDVNRVEVGQPLGVFYAYQFAGVDPATGNALYLNQAGEKTTDPVSADRRIVGSPFPDWTGGLTNTFAFKGFDLNIGFTTTQGNSVYNATGVYANSGGYYSDNQFTSEMAAWTTPGQITNEPRASYDGTSGAQLISSRMIEDGSFVRLSDVTLGFQLPSRLIHGTGLSSARLYVSGRNLYLWTKYRGYDPELNTWGAFGMSYQLGTDFYTYPLARTFSVGISGGW